ncbi:MAG: hypothetical protein XD94_0577 [Mesotoga prima]|jgi:hypothetical protein|uniref:Uncharacterized protein n=1 Tax=Mesotoga prima TaxID=1184387 RepID=A0A117M2T0_9BACT|nr:MAG: hypothetical protein XD94_0577 [Mesotoga prima]
MEVWSSLDNELKQLSYILEQRRPENRGFMKESRNNAPESWLSKNHRFGAGGSLVFSRKKSS